ncbi:MAG: GGDEF domain-containing protein [Lachnospiraceae bacterium]|nr:GGDEF domain-containing protein [Lachnospiraceae bacterium]
MQERRGSMGRKYSDGANYKVIAFVLACFSNDEQRRIIKKVTEECRKHHCKVVFFSTLTDFYFNDLNDAGEKKIFDTISVECYDAIVLMSESFKQDEEQMAMVRRANEAGVPVIAVDKCLEGCINLKFDYGDTFRDIVKHMVEYHGYRTINFMGGMPGNDYSEERLQVYKEVLAENNIPYDPGRVYYGYFWEAPTRVAMDKMFADGLSMPEAIICANDAMAITVCNYMQEKGYRIPEDVAISGFDGIDMERYNRPRLTTGICNVDELLCLIFEIIEEGAPAKYREKVHLVYNRMQIGKSCGCSNLETQQVASEMIQLKSELHQQIKYQGDVNQMVANFGNAERFSDVIEAIPEYMTPLRYREFWFCSNEDLFAEAEMGMNPPKLGYGADNSSYSKVLNVLHYRNDQEAPEVNSKEKIVFGELIPDRKKVLDNNDFIMVLTVHMKGRTAGYAVVSFDMALFWFTAYASFITNFRHLLELQKAQMQLMQVYMCDLLTGLYNRNGFYQKVQLVLEAAENMDMSVISMDMDGLKMINDTYGHAEGDAALKAFGEIIKKSTRHEIAARIGGDEFLIAFVGRDIEERTEEIVSLIKEGIRDYNKAGRKSYELHASIGAYTNRTRNHTLDHFLKKADDLMYARKYLHKKERGDI